MLINGSAEFQKRVLTTVGLVVVLSITAAVVLAVFNPFKSRGADLMSVVIDTPYVGQGVSQGTAVVMHGVTVGEVTDVTSRPGGGVRLHTDLQKAPSAGLTDAMEIDFRPVNYFGVPGVNLRAVSGGTVLRDGMHISKDPRGNFTLQALLARLGEVSTGALTPKLIQVIDKTSRYTDALDPFIETALVAADAVAKVQTVSTAQMLANAAGISEAFPEVLGATVDVGDYFQHYVNYANFDLLDLSDEDFQNRFNATSEKASKGLFAAIGRLESSHVDDLLPVTDTVKMLTDVVPSLIRPEGFVETLAEIRSRFETLYGRDGEQPALQVRIALDALPSVAAPLAAIGGAS